METIVKAEETERIISKKSINDLCLINTELGWLRFVIIC